jgi:hypothetical protein
VKLAERMELRERDLDRCEVERDGLGSTNPTIKWSDQ